MQATGPTNARIMVVVDAPSAEDARRGRPLQDYAGAEFDRQLHEVGLLRTECFVTTVLRRPWEPETVFRNDRKTAPDRDWTWSTRMKGWAAPALLADLEFLDKEIALIQPTLIIVLGDLGLQALVGQWSVSKWRGSYLQGPGGAVVIPTYAPGKVMANWAWRMYAISDLRRAAKVAREGKPTLPNYQFLIRPNLETATSTLLQLLARLNQGPVHLACDIETRAGHLACLGLAWSRTEAICIPFMCVERKDGFWGLDEEVELVKLLRAVLTHPNCLVSGQNFSYDTQYIERYFHFVPNLTLDTMLTHHVCFPGTEKALDILSSLYCEHHVYWKDDRKEWPKGEDENRLWAYNCMDCVRTFEIAEVLVGVAHELGFDEQLLFQHRMWWHCLDTMRLGLRVSTASKRELSVVLQREREARETWIAGMLGHPLNVRSTPQMQALFYTDFGVKQILNRKTRRPSLDDEALGKIAAREPLLAPLIKRIKEIRSLGVFRSTFVEAETDRDGRIRCLYNVAGTETFRLSSAKNAFNTGLNLQNIPKGEEGESDDDIDLPNIRMLFLPDDDCEIADMDLSSADLRIVVAESEEWEMQEMLDAGLDPYTEVAKEFYHDPSISKSDPRRQKFKSFCHGTHYLGTARGLAERLGLSVRDAEATQRWYFNRFPRIERWQTALKAQLIAKRFVANRFGYRRFYFDRVQGTLFNQAAAWIPQSTVGLLINRVWDRVRTEEPWIQVLLQVHDSLVFQYPIDRAEEAREKLAVLSRIPVPYTKPLYIPTGFKTSRKSWGDCE